MAAILPRTSLRALRALPRVAPVARGSFASTLPRAQQPLVQPITRRFLATGIPEQPRLRLGSTGMVSLFTVVSIANCRC